MPNKTTQILKEFREKFFIQDGEISVEKIVDLEAFLTEALSQQQQEDYQKILDLDIMKDEELERFHNNDEDFEAKAYDNGHRRERNDFRKELRQAIAEKRGKE